ncbi:MAG: glycosyltransferase family 4 protein [Clostridia bacterium]|nr:glycosyltransferase family 4 protein [Clostridia bacterium]
MKIVHMCLASFFPDNYSYQENMLPKFHKKLGYEVEVIASPQSYDEHGKACLVPAPDEYINENGIKVTRLPFKGKSSIAKKLRRYSGTCEALEKAAPDVLFIHGGQFSDMDRVVKYLKSHRDVRVYVDNHADFSNSAKNPISKIIYHGMIWKRCEKMIEPYAVKFYGVLPARVDFLKDVYGLPPEKCELLVMGADDDLVAEAKNRGLREKIRAEYGLKTTDFVIATGGKINANRPETLSLMEAVIRLDRPDVRLLVFGNASDELKPRFDELCKSGRIVYAGWIKSSETYGMFEASDLVVFPGLHSVMWEQAVAQGKPCLFRDIEGFHHVDIGGNAVFLKDVSTDGLAKAISDVADNPEKLNEMKRAAEEKGMKEFSYLEIARRCLL